MLRMGSQSIRIMREGVYTVPQAATRTTKTDLVYAKIRKAILGRALAPGDRISAHGLARKYGVAGSAVRESFARLKAEGLIRSDGPYSRSYVQGIDIDRTVEHYEARESVEGMAARLAAQNMNAYQVAELERLGEVVIRDLDDPDVSEEQRWKDGKAFTRYLVANCGNKLLLKIYEMHHLEPVGVHMRDGAEEVIRNVMGVSTFDYLQRLCGAIRSRQADDAEACIRQRIRAVTEQMRASRWSEVEGEQAAGPDA